jgi:hypothetical protein
MILEDPAGDGEERTDDRHDRRGALLGNAKGRRA